MKIRLETIHSPYKTLFPGSKCGPGPRGGRSSGHMHARADLNYAGGAAGIMSARSSGHMSARAGRIMSLGVANRMLVRLSGHMPARADNHSAALGDNQKACALERAYSSQSCCPKMAYPAPFFSISSSHFLHTNGLLASQ